MALIRAKPDTSLYLEPWQRACDRFLDGLSQEQANIFRTTTKPLPALEELFCSADALRREHLQKSKIAKFLEKTGPFFQVLQSYGSAIDVYANASSTFLCPIWGSVKVLALVRLWG